MNTIKFYTLGCKANQFDTQSIRERFLKCGFKEIIDGKKAGIYLINTCTVTASADRQSKALIRSCKKINPRAKVIITGCLVEKDSASLIGLKGIDFIIGKKFFPEGIKNFSGHTRAFLKVQDGCNNFCSYCKVPLVRGVSRSRPLEEIVCDAAQLVKNGFKEIVLTGICLGLYGKDLPSGTGLVDVINKIEAIDGLARLRLSSIEAGDVTPELINKIAASKKICPHLHIPIQSGDDTILKKMNRRYSREDYLKLIRTIKRHLPEIAVTTDVIVGFPGENELNFKNTLDLIKSIKPLKVHIFPYSKRSGTYAASNFHNEVNPLIIKERLLRLKALADGYAYNYKKEFLGRFLDVLIEGRSKDDKAFWQGHTGNYIKVLVKSKKDLSSQIIPLKLKEIKNEELLGCFH